jgi:phytoene desaturase
MAEPTADSYDVVVVGGGLGGLSAGASLAKLGRSVLVLEQHDAPGGYAHVFRREGYTFDPAIHWTAQAQEDGLLDSYLKVLGVRDHVEFVRSDTQYGVSFPGFSASFPSGLEAFVDAHMRHFPGQADGLAAFFKACVGVTHESQQAGMRVSLRDLDQAVEEFPLVFKYRRATAADVIDEYVTDERARALCGVIWPHMAVPPSRVAFVVYAGQLTATVETGPFYPRGSFQTLADAFVTALDRNGGELVLGTKVTRITLQDGRVAGVELESGERIAAEIVISNADGKMTYEQLIGTDLLPKPLVRQLGRLTPTLSAFLIYVATTLDPRDFGLAHEVFISRHWDHEQSFADVQAGKPGGLWVAFPSMHDSSLAPEGEHLAVLTSVAPYDLDVSWEVAKDSWTDLLLDELDTILPGVRDNLRFVDSATPRTLERFTLNQRGAMYGWEPTPGQSLGKRLRQQSPIEGLVLAGHWTEPGSGSLRTIYSGIGAAQVVAGIPALPDFLGTLAAGARV